MRLTALTLAFLVAASALPVSCRKVEPGPQGAPVSPKGTPAAVASRAPVPRRERETPAPGPVEEKPRVTSSEVGVATWYDLSEKSLPARRAPGELTAASDRLPMGSTVRVVNLSNGKSVLVRITDRGVHQPRAIDLCKEAALEIGLVGKGVTKVRVERFDDSGEVAADPRP